MNPSSLVTIMALLAEMARCLNQNMSKVVLTPIDPAFCAGVTAVEPTPPSESSNA
jgi:hypothetical protein